MLERKHSAYKEKYIALIFPWGMVAICVEMIELVSSNYIMSELQF